MQTEIFAGSKEPAAVTFEDRYNTKTHEVASTEITISTVPPTSIQVFPNGVAINKGSFGLTVDAPTSLRWGGRKLIVDARDDDNQLLVNQNGRIVLVEDPESIGDIEVVSFLKAMSNNPRKRFSLADIPRFANLDIRRPKLFQDVTPSEFTRFLLIEKDWTATQLHMTTGIEPTALEFFLSGRTQLPKSPARLLTGFGLQTDEPAYSILSDSIAAVQKRQALTRSKAKKLAISSKKHSLNT